MKEDKERYFNVPIALFRGFLDDSLECLNNVFDYATYSHSQTLEGSQAEQYKATLKWFGVTASNHTNSIKNGKELSGSIPLNSPMVGINKTMYFDFYQNDKTEFDKVCLLGFLAIKSILQKKTYWKLDNKFWLSRMDGKNKSVEFFSELSGTMQNYAKEYQTVKIKTELRNNWGLVTYSRYTRGFYVSFSLTLEQMVFEAEMRRKSNKEKQYKELEKQAIKQAFLKLNI